MSAIWHLNNWVQKIKNKKCKAKGPQTILKCDIIFSLILGNHCECYTHQVKYLIFNWFVSRHQHTIRTLMLVPISSLEILIQKSMRSCYTTHSVLLEWSFKPQRYHQTFSIYLIQKRVPSRQLVIVNDIGDWVFEHTDLAAMNCLIDHQTMASVCTPLLNQVYTHSTWTCNIQI